MLCVVSVEAADPVGCFKVTAILEVVLDGLFSGPMCLLRHDFFFTKDWVLGA